VLLSSPVDFAADVKVFLQYAALSEPVKESQAHEQSIVAMQPVIVQVDDGQAWAVDVRLRIARTLVNSPVTLVLVVDARPTSIGAEKSSNELTWKNRDVADTARNWSLLVAGMVVIILDKTVG